jgi:hypothetical protein
MAASALNVQPHVAHASAKQGSAAAHADAIVSHAAREIDRFTVASHDISAKIDTHTALHLQSERRIDEVRRGAEVREATVGEWGRNARGSAPPAQGGQEKRIQSRE